MTVYAACVRVAMCVLCVRASVWACVRVCRGRERQLGLSQWQSGWSRTNSAGGAGERLGGRSSHLVNKSSVWSLRAPPAEGTGEPWLPAREVGLPRARHASFIMPSAGGSWGLAVGKFPKPPPQPPPPWRGPARSVEWVCELQVSLPVGWAEGFLVQRKLTLSDLKDWNFSSLSFPGSLFLPLPLKAL